MKTKTIPSFNRAVCNGCGACVRTCPAKMIELKQLKAVLIQSRISSCIQCGHCFAICPAGAVSFNGYTAENGLQKGPVPDPEFLMNMIRQRRSIRFYKNTPIQEESLSKLKALLPYMPTGCNDHRLHFTIIHTPDSLEALHRESRKIVRFLQTTCLLKLLFPSFRKYEKDFEKGADLIFRNAACVLFASSPANAPCRNADPWIALSYLDLQAQSMGLGSCWCGFGVYAAKWSRSLRKMLEIPPGYRVGAVLLLGTPDEIFCRPTMPMPVDIIEK